MSSKLERALSAKKERRNKYRETLAKDAAEREKRRKVIDTWENIYAVMPQDHYNSVPHEKLPTRYWSGWAGRLIAFVEAAGAAGYDVEKMYGGKGGKSLAKLLLVQATKTDKRSLTDSLKDPGMHE